MTQKIPQPGARPTHSLQHADIEQGLNANLNPIIRLSGAGTVLFASGNLFEYAPARPARDHSRVNAQESTSKKRTRSRPICNDEHTQERSGKKSTCTSQFDGKFHMTYRTADSGKRICLNSLIDESTHVLIPVESRFCYKIQDQDRGLLRRPEIHLSIPQLEESEIHLLSVLHEIGHAKLYETFFSVLHACTAHVFSDSSQTGHSKKLFDRLEKRIESQLRERFVFATNSHQTNAHQTNSHQTNSHQTNSRQTKSYRTQYSEELAALAKQTLTGSMGYRMRATHAFFETYLGDEHFTILHERYAWAYALKTIRQHRILDQYSTHALRRHYQSHLRSYGDAACKSILRQ